MDRWLDLISRTEVKEVERQVQETEKVDVQFELINDRAILAVKDGKPLAYRVYTAIEGDPLKATRLAIDFMTTAKNVKAGGEKAGYTGVNEDIKEEVDYNG